MQSYIIRRLLLMIPTLFVVTTVLFISVRFIPGSMIDLLISELGGRGFEDTERTAAEIEKTLGLDQPIHVQYGRWVGDAFQGDLGESLWTQQPIAEDLMNRLPVSIELGLFAIISALLLAMPIGIYSAIRQDSASDYGGRTVAILAISLPNFWIATLVIVYPSIWWDWSPSLKYIPLTDDLLGNFKQFILPGWIMGLYYSGTIMRMVRTMMLEVLRQDYIRTAWAKGLREQTVILRHAIRNALIPVITLVGILAPALIAGNIVIEQVFNLPGVGQFLIDGISRRDYPVIVGVNLFFATGVMFINLIVDLTYAWLDPRIRFK